jgi:hypothetical protein
MNRIKYVFGFWTKSIYETKNMENNLWNKSFKFNS